MLVALLSSLGALKSTIIVSERQLWLGELRLDGTVCPIIGMPVILEAAARLGYKEVWCSDQCLNQLAQQDYGVKICTINHISELVNQDACHRSKLNGNLAPPQKTSTSQLSETGLQALPSHDWQVLLSQPMVEKALLIAAAGWHHTLLVGPPGLGKTTVAALLIELLPALQPDELAQVIKVRSLVSGNQDSGLRRSCIQVNAYSTMTNLIGNAKQNCLGAVSRAHKGVLFLDELLHFPAQQLDALRDPLELGEIVLQNNDRRFPADFLFIGVTNPCKCGNALSQFTRCRCGTNALFQLQRKLDAAWLDRMSLCMYIDYQPTSWQVKPLSLEVTQQKVSQLKSITEAVWMRQQKRWGAGWHNGRVKNLEQIAQLVVSKEAQLLLQQTKQHQFLSERSCNKLLLVASTIADIDAVTNNHANSIAVDAKHVAEAVQFRAKLFSS